MMLTTPALAQQQAEQHRSLDVIPEPPTFAYTTRAEPRPVRAAVELGGVLAVGFAWYAVTRRGAIRDGNLGYSWSVFRKKITGRAFGPDTNHFGTNFVGHPLGGTGYFLAARSNRLTVLESFAYAVGGSLVWELFGEVTEVVSLNDTLVTPFAGLAIGESTTQLATFFDRSAGTHGHRFVASVFGAPKKLNDWFDGLAPRRSRTTFPAEEWHRFELVTESALVHQLARTGASASTTAEVRVEASSHLVRLRGWDEAGSDVHRFDDGNASRIHLSAAFGAGGLSDFRYASDVVVAGVYFRSGGGKSRRGNGYVGLASGFDYSVHDHERGVRGPADRWAVIRPLGVAFEQRGRVGRFRVATRVDVSGDFGGVRPLAPAVTGVAPGDSPPILTHRGYYFGLGGHVGSQIRLETGPIDATAAMSAEALRGVGGPGDPVRTRLEDWRARARGRVGYRVPKSVAVVHVSAERRARLGVAGRARASAEELSLGVGVGAIF
jgi:hypothetical protein